MNTMHLIFYIVAVPATVILILQTVLLLFGLGNDGADVDGEFDSDFDVDTDADIELDADGIPDSAEYDTDHDAAGNIGDSGLRLFTVRGMVAFFAVGGWAGIASLEIGAPNWAAALIALAAGCAALVLVAYFFKWAMKLRSDGSLKMKNAVGHSGEVYMTIPANAEGKGKVNVIVQERYAELDAITKGDRELKHGDRIKVVAMADNNTVIVEAE